MPPFLFKRRLFYAYAYLPRVFFTIRRVRDAYSGLPSSRNQRTHARQVPGICNHLLIMRLFASPNDAFLRRDAWMIIFFSHSLPWICSSANIPTDDSQQDIVLLDSSLAHPASRANHG